VRASTPSNVAELLTRDRKTEKLQEKIEMIYQKIISELRILESELAQKKRIIETLNPENILKQGYAILAGDINVGSVVKITTLEQEIEAEILKLKKKGK
jgi:exonuclease VII large subunit